MHKSSAFLRLRGRLCRASAHDALGPEGFSFCFGWVFFFFYGSGRACRIALHRQAVATKKYLFWLKHRLQNDLLVGMGAADTPEDEEEWLAEMLSSHHSMPSQVAEQQSHNMDTSDDDWLK